MNEFVLYILPCGTFIHGYTQACTQDFEKEGYILGRNVTMKNFWHLVHSLISHDNVQENL